YHIPMALTAGTRLGPYAITAQIGVSGMGEVYRVTDTNLKREVAVKVLPSTFAANPERLVPSTDQTLLLRASLRSGEACWKAWENWRQRVGSPNLTFAVRTCFAAS
ncbi:MAG: hypothetical protein V3V07_08135, partial [candidate division NC10 bacterium]